MKCTNCGAENNSFAEYCRDCGKLLRRRSIRDLYPEFHFQPTSTFSLKGNKQWWYAIVPLFLLIAFGVLVFGTYVHDFSEQAIPVALGVIVSAIILIKCYKKATSTKIKSIADYIEGEPENGRYSIIVKDGLWGLYDTSRRKIQIACQYDFLKWESNGSILRATKDNVNFLIDIYNKKLK